LPRLLNIGWLDLSHQFHRGCVPAGFLKRLASFCELAVAQTRGFHECEFCQAPTLPLIEGGLKLGSAEIRVFADDGTIFAAPNLILHYVSAHDYCPPPAFIDAVMTSISPPSTHYSRSLESAQIVAVPCLRDSTCPPPSLPPTPRG
jgi:hypothetical protein